MGLGRFALSVILGINEYHVSLLYFIFFKAYFGQCLHYERFITFRRVSRADIDIPIQVITLLSAE
jgi:hypothetical protein